jgi:hypothetical protein
MGIELGNASGSTPEQNTDALKNPSPPPPAILPCKKHRIVFKFIREKTNKEISAVQASVEQNKGPQVEMPASDEKGISKVETGETAPFQVIAVEAEALYDAVAASVEDIPADT